MQFYTTISKNKVAFENDSYFSLYYVISEGKKFKIQDDHIMKNIQRIFEDNWNNDDRTMSKKASFKLDTEIEWYKYLNNLC